MHIQKIATVAAALLLLGAAGCQSNRFSSFGGSGGARATAPAPLPAAPSGNVVAQQLPPPAMTPPPPPPPTETQVAAIDPAAGTAPPASGGAAVSEGSVAGVWNVSVAGQSCRVATPRTKFGQGYRAAPLRCPAPLDGVKSWNVQGGQVLLFDENGGTLASLSSSGGESFSGSTTSGQPVSLTR